MLYREVKQAGLLRTLDDCETCLLLIVGFTQRRPSHEPWRKVKGVYWNQVYLYKEVNKGKNTSTYDLLHVPVSKSMPSYVLVAAVPAITQSGSDHAEWLRSRMMSDSTIMITYNTRSRSEALVQSGKRWDSITFEIWSTAFGTPGSGALNASDWGLCKAQEANINLRASNIIIEYNPASSHQTKMVDLGSFNVWRGKATWAPLKFLRLRPGLQNHSL